MQRRNAFAGMMAAVSIVTVLMPNPAIGQGQNVRLVGQIGGGCGAVQVVGNYAYIGEGQKLRILDVSNPASPVPLGRVLFPETVVGVFVSGGLAYVSDRMSGLQIIDVTNPTAPTLRGSCKTPYIAYGVYVSGSLAYVADGYSGLQIIDVSNPSAPTLRGSHDTPGFAYGVHVTGGLAYVADDVSGLQIIDVSNPSAPALRGTYDTPGYARGVYVSGGLAYVADYGSGLQIIDVTNPSAPTLRGTYDTPGSARGVCVSGGLAYVADAYSGLQIIDVSNPSAPTLRGTYDTPGNAGGVYVTGGLAYVADGPSGLQIIDVTNPTAPTLRGFYDTPPGYALGVYVSGGLAYVADDATGLQIIDVSNPSAPALRGTYNTPGDARGVYVSGGLAYVVDYGSGLQIIDVSNPAAPSLRGSYNTPGYARGVYVSGGLAYVADYSSGLQIIDVSNPAAPTLRGTYDTPGNARGVYVSSGMAYVADDVTGLQIIDASNPSSPQLRGSYDTPGDAYGVHVTGGFSYVADWASGLQIIDVSNPSAPTLRGSYDTPQYAEGVYVTGGLVYVADAYSGLQIIDVSNPSAPTLRGSYDTPGYAPSVYVTGGLAYVAAMDAGVWILQYTGEAPRIQGATISDVNNNGLIEAGDQLVLTLDRSVVVSTSVLRASHFFLAVAGDSLGGAGFGVGVNPVNSRQIVLTLGAGVHLTAAGSFSMQNRMPDSPSGIDFATSIPFGAIKSLDGISALDGGAFGVDDSGIDIELSMVGRTATIGPTGGAIAVVPSPDAAYTRHELGIPAGALSLATTFTLRPPEVTLGVIGAVQVVSSNPNVVFRAPSTIHLEYREGDIDFERGQLEVDMRVHQLVENPAGVFRYVPLPGPHTLERAALAGHPAGATKFQTTHQRVSAMIDRLNPMGSLGQPRVFAGLPVETVDQKRVPIAPRPPGGIVRSQAGFVLMPGERGEYTSHSIEFPGWQATTETDPARVVIKIRTASKKERESPCGGRSFPKARGAVFVVTAEDATSRPVAFRDPVHITVQFKHRGRQVDSDCVQMDGAPVSPEELRLVRDRFSGEAVDFEFVGGVKQVVDVVRETVRAENVVGLTGEDGMGTWGVTAPVLPPTRTAHWSLYR
jgi:hypothetical protein